MGDSVGGSAQAARRRAVERAEAGAAAQRSGGDRSAYGYSRGTGGRRRRRFTIARKGRTALTAWLREPAETPTEIRDLGLLKLFFSSLAALELGLRFEAMVTDFWSDLVRRPPSGAKPRRRAS
jgi:hypothetical protein